jgi:endonuclease/exonuclease/phosphatase family metal-dependent hydrolase
MLLSRKPLYGTNVLTTPNGHKIIQTVWRAEEGVDVFVVALHPPSPRSEELWHQRNAVINTALKLVERSPLETTILVGDFNLASTTRRYRDLSRNFQSAPVNTWPVFLKNWNVPVWPLVALDHLLLTSVNDKNRICSREALTEIKGSDHYPVLTKMSLE